MAISVYQWHENAFHRFSRSDSVQSEIGFTVMCFSFFHFYISVGNQFLEP